MGIVMRRWGDSVGAGSCFCVVDGWVDALLPWELSRRLLLESVVESLSVRSMGGGLRGNLCWVGLSSSGEDVSVLRLDSINAGCAAVMKLFELLLMLYEFGSLALSGPITTMTDFATTIGVVPLARSRMIDGCRQYSAFPTSFSPLALCHVSASFSSNSSAICLRGSCSKPVGGSILYRLLDDLRS